MQFDKPYIGLQTKITLLVCGVVALALLVTNIFISANVASNTQKSLAEKALDVARITAHSPLVRDALAGKREQADIQSYAEEIRGVTQVEFIVVMDMQGIRKSHPDSSKLGLRFVGGDETGVLEGKEYTSLGEGTLGLSLRAFTPVFGEDGRQVGAVSVGILLNNVQQAVEKSRSVIYWAVVFGLLIGIAGAVILARNIKKTLFGLEPRAIARLVEERSAMLLSVREGIIAVDKEARITLVNAAAGRLLEQAGVTGDPIGKNVEAFIPNTRLSDVLRTGKAELDQEQDLKGITLLTNRVPMCVGGEIIGAVATFRDKTEIHQLAEQLTGVRNYAEALRAQAHEFMNKLHVILGMVRLESYEQLAGYIKGIAHQYQEEIGSVIRRIKDPVLAGFLLGKLSHAREAGVEMVITAESFVPESSEAEVSGELVTIVGNLINNALEAVQHSTVKKIEVECLYRENKLYIKVSDTGPGFSSAQTERLFSKGFSTKAENRGLGLFLVQRSLERVNGTIEVISELGQGTCFTVSLPYLSKGDMQ